MLFGGDRCVFVCDKHAARTCARAACSNSHSQDQAGAWSWVPSYLPYSSLLFIPDRRAYVSISSGFPAGFGFLGNPSLKCMRVVPCSLYRPPTRACLRVIPFRCSVLRSFRRILSTGYVSGERMKRVQIPSHFSSRLHIMSLCTVTILVKSVSLFDLLEVTMGQPYLQLPSPWEPNSGRYRTQACRTSFGARFTD